MDINGQNANFLDFQLFITFVWPYFFNSPFTKTSTALTYVVSKGRCGCVVHVD